MPAMWTIYMATNRLNGKRYIGVTGKGLKLRRARHLYRASIGDRGCPRLYDALRKYGAKNFKWQVLATFAFKEMAYHHEFVLVEKLKPEYNVYEGGNAGPDEAPNKKPVICLNDGKIYDSATEAARAYGCDNSEVSKACKGTGIHAKWKYFRYYLRPLSQAEREQLIEMDKNARTKRMFRGGSRKANMIKGNARRGKEVICIEDGKVFDSASAAARYYDLNKSSMIEMCLGRKRWPLGGRHFSYITEVGQRWVA